jgi:holin-like protein
VKMVRGFLIILIISFLGEVLHAILPFPIPASIYGLVLMLSGLTSGVIPLRKIEKAGVFLIDVMPMLFIPAGVGLMVSWVFLKPVFVPVILITIITTVLVMAVTGRVTQAILKREREKNA